MARDAIIKEILIVGGGFAGMWAALAATLHDMPEKAGDLEAKLQTSGD